MAEPQQVEMPVQLIVEGNDQLNFFQAFLDHHRISGVQIQNFGGVTELSPFLETLAAGREFRSRVNSLGIVRDAETGSAQSAFQSVQGSLRRAGLPVPDQPNQRIGGNPSVTVFILPDNTSSGMLETLLCNTLDETLEHCIEDFFECITTSTGEGLRSPEKSRAFAYIATKPAPNVSVGVATKKKYWNLDHPAFDQIRAFLRTL